MVKHTLTIRRQFGAAEWNEDYVLSYNEKLPTNCLAVFDHLAGLALRELTKLVEYDSYFNILRINFTAHL